MSALSTSKLYTIDHAWHSGRDLRIRCLGQPIYYVVFHTQRIGNISTLSIHDKRMNGHVLCAGVLDQLAGFTYKTAGQKAKYHLQKREDLSIWEQEYQFKPAKATLAWKQARPGQPALPTNLEQGDSAPALGQRDWILVAANEERSQVPDRLLAVYSAPKGTSQQARIHFVEELGAEAEVGALAVILGIVRWNYTRPGKLLSSAFSSAPAFMA